MKVLCFGSLNIDYTYRVPHFVQKGETLSSESLEVFSGGKGLNQSVALAKAGVDTYHAGVIGEDGMFLVKVLQEAGVHTELIKIRSDVRTGNAIIQNDHEGDNCILLYGGANQAVTEKQVDETIEKFEKGDFLLIQNEINELSYIVQKAHEKQMKIVLNPSPMNEKILNLPLEYIDYFVLNEIETAQILGEELKQEYDGEELAQKLKNRFSTAAVLMTMGAEGSVYIDNEQTVTQEAFRVKAVDTTAAGDTFTGFFLSGLARGIAVKNAMEEASKASAIAVTRKGAAPSIPVREEVEKFSEK